MTKAIGTSDGRLDNATPPSRWKSSEEQALPVGADLVLPPETQVPDICFAPIPGLKIVEYRAPSRNRLWDAFVAPHGWNVVDEPCKGETMRANHEGHPKPLVERMGARIPGDVQRGQ